MTLKIDKLPEVLTRKEVASLLRVHVYTVRRWERQGLLTSIMEGIRPRYSKKDILKLLHLV